MRQSRGNLYLLTGLLIGLGLGLLYSYLVAPIQYVDTAPYALRAEDKDLYRSLISLAFRATNNFDRARQRLLLLNDLDPAQSLGAQAQRVLAYNGSADEARALSRLASIINPQSPTLAFPTATKPAAATQASPTSGPTPNPSLAISPSPTLGVAQSIQTPTRAPSATPSPVPSATRAPTFTPIPSATVPPVQTAPYVLKDRKKLCGNEQPARQLQIEVSNASGQPLAGVRITVTSKEGEDFFYTGLYPEIGPGYADFSMNPNTTYSLRVGDASDPVSDLAVPDCGGGWKLTFGQKGG